MTFADFLTDNIDIVEITKFEEYVQREIFYISEDKQFHCGMEVSCTKSNCPIYDICDVFKFDDFDFTNIKSDIQRLKETHPEYFI